MKDALRSILNNPNHKREKKTKLVKAACPSDQKNQCQYGVSWRKHRSDLHQSTAEWQFAKQIGICKMYCM